MTTVRIRIPHNFEPRFYQLPIFRALDDGIRRVVLVWHRRAGKDKACFNLMVKQAFKVVGNYYYIFPTYAQGKKALWDNIDNDGFRTINHIPEELIQNQDGQQMFLRLANGSTINVVGTDGKNIDRLVGTNPAGCVFSEYALQDPRAWSLMRPILAANGGWAIFNSTPRGKNHMYDLVNMAKDNPKKWYVDVLTVDHTGIIDPDVLDDERREMDEDLFLQEYHCSFEAAVRGAYYSQQMKEAEADGRIGIVPYDPVLDVYTVWDLGMTDSTAIWFYQMYGNEVRCIDYYENSGESLDHYVMVMKEKGYNYGTIYLPHDAMVKEFSTGKSRVEHLLALGFRDIEVVPKLAILEGIDMARRMFRNVYFDKEKCKQGIRCLNEYHKEWDDKNQTYKPRPHHDWSSHGADAFRYLAVSIKKKVDIPKASVSQDYF